MNGLKKPKAIKKGDRIGLIAPSSPVSHPDRVEASVQKLEEFGFEVAVGESCYGQYGYLAGEDSLRAEDINRMFADPEIDAIVCIRGGYGTPRIIDQLDYEMIEKNPKLFVGYSDITTLHIALNQRCKMVTLHSPMPASDMLRDFDEYSAEGFLQAISSSEPLGEMKNPEGEEVQCLVKGVATGPIVGGNLSLIAATIGTAYEIDTKGKLLFLEDTDEEPYSIDRMLSQLRLAGKLDDCNGIILGDWNNCVPKDAKPSLTLHEVFQDLLVPTGKPIICNFKAGHCKPTMTLPLGVEAILDADHCKLTITEGAAV
ncbi:MAG TPA: LD-carboxypeptidase [Bacillus sp. (in: firmicutes)]|nr:LD-carboxypeptidase [Bacillus sp. (in: firmicutes)]